MEAMSKIEHRRGKRVRLLRMHKKKKKNTLEIDDREREGMHSMSRIPY